MTIPQGPQTAVLRLRTSPRTPDPAPGPVAWVRAAQALDEATRRRMFQAFLAHPGATVVAAPRPGGPPLFAQDRVADGATVARTPGVFASAALAVRQDVFTAWDLAGVARALAAGELVWLADPVEVAGGPLPPGDLASALRDLAALPLCPSRPARWPEAGRGPGLPRAWGVDGADLQGAVIAGSLCFAARSEVAATLRLRLVAEQEGRMDVERDGEAWGGTVFDAPGSAYDVDITLEGGPDPAWLTVRTAAALVVEAAWRT